MPSFVFRVGTPDGDVVEREIRANDLRSAREEAQRQGLHVFTVKRRSRPLRTMLRPSRKALSTQHFLLFNQELLALVRAGLPIIHSFDLMLERQKSPRFREILTEVRDKVKAGVAISDAFAAYGNLFPPIYSSSLRAGERSGDLEGVLRRFLRYQKLIVNLQRKVVGALIYPAVIVAISLAMVLVMLTVVIPKFTEFYTGFDAELPLVTRMLIALAFTLRNNIVIWAAVVFGLYLAVRRWAETESGGMLFDSLKLRIPVVGDVLYKFAILQFTQSLGTLLAGGTPMVPAIEIASESITNRAISRRVHAIVQRVREGEPLWRSLDATGVMSDLAVEMIKVGESTGALVEMLTNVSEFYDEEIESTLSRMVSLIEPIILVVLGGIVAGLLYAFYLPLFELISVQR
ncbi:MAG TPA: type II secretion system F family protein [Thermoanaerobaculia bacterium]|nr:type II secretion system F family protein [Thermoanaerobaculia bacterium]